MAEFSPSPFSTPKRKRTDVVNEDAPSPLHTYFSFEVDASNAPTAGGSSPRSKVAHTFRGLALVDSGGGVAAGDPQQPRARGAAPLDTDIAERMEIDKDESKMRKRSRISPEPPKTQETPQTPDIRKDEYNTTSINDVSPKTTNDNPQISINQTSLPTSPATSPAKLLQPQGPVDNRPIEALKPNNRKRAGTPPLVGPRPKAGNADQPRNTDDEIVDPVRAALTWQEDEITIYDPEDADDDGVGINGIGFKPTPAIAYARTMKRKQQLADYKKREEREARARRSHRRRGSPERAASKLERKESARKVRFTETDSTMMIRTI